MSGILKKKQVWRRQATSSSRREHDCLYNNQKNIFIGSVFPRQRTVSMEVISFQSTNSNNNHSIGKSWATTGDLPAYQNNDKLYKDEKPIKKIRFSSSVRVVLIPTAVEYEEANICDLVWWNDTDYRLFKQDAVQELKTFLIHRPNLDAKEAIKVLYQSKFDNEVVEAVSLIDCIASVSSDTTTTTNSTDEESVSFYNESVDSFNNSVIDEISDSFITETSLKLRQHKNPNSEINNREIDIFGSKDNETLINNSNEKECPSEKANFQKLSQIKKQQNHSLLPHLVVNETHRYIENGVHDLTNDELFNYSRRCTWL